MFVISIRSIQLRAVSFSLQASIATHIPCPHFVDFYFSCQSSGIADWHLARVFATSGWYWNTTPISIRSAVSITYSNTCFLTFHISCIFVFVFDSCVCIYKVLDILCQSVKSEMANASTQAKTVKVTSNECFAVIKKEEKKTESITNGVVPLCRWAWNGSVRLSNAFCIHFYSSALYFYFVFFRMCFHSVRTRFIHLKEQSKLFRKINHVAWCVIQCACVRVSCHNQYTPKNIGNAEVKGKKIVRVKRRARFIYFKTQIFGCFCWHWMVEVNWVRHHAKSINRS